MLDATGPGDCVWITTGQRIVMVPASLVGSYDEPFRLAEAGEAQAPVWMEDTLCEVHEETSFSWRPILAGDLDAVRDAINMGCDGGCHCLCHRAKPHLS